MKVNVFGATPALGNSSKKKEDQEQQGNEDKEEEKNQVAQQPQEAEDEERELTLKIAVKAKAGRVISTTRPLFFARRDQALIQEVYRRRNPAKLGEVGLSLHGICSV